MDIVDRRRLIRELRWVEIVDLVGLRIEDVEKVDPNLCPIGSLIAALKVEQQGRLRGDAVILDQRSPPEITEAQFGAPGIEIDQPRITGRNDLRCARNVVAGMTRLRIGRTVVGVRVACVSEGEIAVEFEPGEYAVGRAEVEPLARARAPTPGPRLRSTAKGGSTSTSPGKGPVLLLRRRRSSMFRSMR